METLKRFYREVDHLEGSHERRGLKVDNAYLDFGILRYAFELVDFSRIRSPTHAYCHLDTKNRRFRWLKLPIQARCYFLSRCLTALDTDPDFAA